MDEQAPSSDLTSAPIKQRRRRYPPEFKEQVLRECEQPGASVAGVAVSHGLNPNLVHNWRRTHNILAPSGFVQLPAPGPVVETSPTIVRIDVPTPKGTLVVHWPLSEMPQSVTWLRALTR
ncbi:transposase [Congregibacter litoralis]|uniref:Transposase n=1 Tax=Congregibacter litoralis KT71 TaxID=314285 RepID=A4A6Q9_9GAMM|nr:Transposase [Congregibacter litoralis KT71]EAQ97978.1 Transposase [Congregibacter litoralis KT71]